MEAIRQQQKSTIKQLAAEIRDRRGLIVFIGAGTSIDAGMPTYSKLLIELKDRLSSNVLIERQFHASKADPEELFQKVKRSKQADILCKEIRAIFTSRPANATTLDAVFPNLRLLPTRCIVTTNYDDLIEQTLMKLQWPFEVKVGMRPALLRSLANAMQHAIQLFKIAGCINDCTPADLVIGYEDKPLRNSKAKTFKTLLTYLGTWFPVLFLGYSFSDTFFTEMVELMREVSPRYGLYSITNVNDPSARQEHLAYVNIIPILEYHASDYSALSFELLRETYIDSLHQLIDESDNNTAIRILSQEVNAYLNQKVPYRSGIVRLFCYVSYYSDIRSASLSSLKKEFTLRESRADLSPYELIDIGFYWLYFLLEKYRSGAHKPINFFADHRLESILNRISHFLENEISMISEEGFDISIQAGDLNNCISYYSIVKHVMYLLWNRNDMPEPERSEIENSIVTLFKNIAEPISTDLRPKIHKYKALWKASQGEFEAAAQEIMFARYYSAAIKERRETLLIEYDATKIELMRVLSTRAELISLTLIRRNLEQILNKFLNMGYHTGSLYVAYDLSKCLQAIMDLADGKTGDVLSSYNILKEQTREIVSTKGKQYHIEKFTLSFPDRS